MINNIQTICISLVTRPDKWWKVVDEFPKLGMRVKRFKAVQHPIGHVGCIRSHQEVHRQHKRLGVYMIIEDDIKVIGSVSDLRKAISQLPNNWDCLYLGATLTKPLIKYSPNLFILKGGLTTHAIIYNNQNGIADHIADKAFSPILESQQIDTFMTSVQERFNCFITSPMICTQEPGYSDTCDQFTSYDIINKSYNKYTR